MQDRKNILALYGNKRFFEERQKDGYTEVAFGVSMWTKYDKILAIWAFYRPKDHPKSGIIRTVEYPKAIPGKDDMNHGPPCDRIYSQHGFDEHLKKYKLNMGERVSLDKVLKSPDW